jgi:succinylglutamic semialdehyde dehydrogenase
MSIRMTSISPVDGSVVWEGEATRESEVRESIGRAVVGQRAWAKAPLEHRIEVAQRYAASLKSRRDGLANMISKEMGKAVWEAKQEVDTAVAKIDVSIEAIRARRWTNRATIGAMENVVRYRPMGVLAVLGPFNFPLHLPGSHIVPSLLAGNAVVFKPSDQTPAVGEAMVAAWHEAGVPESVLQIVHGGIDTARAMAADPQTAGVLLTGSYQAGRALHQLLAGRPEVLLALELGGNNPLVVTEVADPNAAAIVAALSGYISSGQRCTCARRLIVVDNACGRAVVARLTELVQGLRFGLPISTDDWFAGPLVSAAAAAKVFEGYQAWVDQGATPIIPMRRDEHAPALVYPALVDASGRSLEDEEVFGPLMQLHWVRDFDVAIDLARQTKYGLAAALLSDHATQWQRFVDEVPAGIINWNRPTTGASGKLPFGGLGASGNHRPSAAFAADYVSDPIASLEVATLAVPADIPPGFPSISI